MKLLERFKKDSKFAMLVMLVIALIVMILFAFFAHFLIWFWITLVLWIVFFWQFKVLYAMKFLMFVLFIFIILAWSIITMSFVHYYDFSGRTDSRLINSLVPCTSTASDSPTAIAGYKASMFSQPVEYEGTADTGVRTFSIKELDAKTGNDIFFNFVKNGGGFITGTKGLIEVCSEDNMTQKYSSTKDSTTTAASDQAAGLTYYMHGNDKITEPGTYRVDGYANVDGTWKMVGRISGIIVTQ